MEEGETAVGDRRRRSSAMLDNLAEKRGKWTEWEMKFRATVKEFDVGLFRALDMAAEAETEIDMEEVENSGVVERAVEKSAMLYNRMVHLLNGPALTLHQSVAEENGLEVWRLLKKRYDPKTTMRNLQLWLKIMNPGKARKSHDFLAQVNRWEGWINTLKRDYSQEVAETARVGLLILMAPDELQSTILEHADRLRNCAQVKEKMVMLLDARGRLKDPNAMDVGYAGAEARFDEWFDEEASEEDDIGALGRHEHCFRCGGMGHMAAECSTPKGKGKGREDKVFQSKGGKGMWDKGGSRGQWEKGAYKGAKGAKGMTGGKGTRRARAVARTARSATIAVRGDTTGRGVGRYILNSFHGKAPTRLRRSWAIGATTAWR